jgi:hypothetical protein
MVLRRLRRSLLAALALTAVAPSAHAADPAWHAVAPPVADFPNSAVALRFDPFGTAFAVWNASGSSSQLATRPSAGAFGAPQPTLSAGVTGFGFAADGGSVFVGTDATIRAAARGAGANGTFGTIQSLGAGGFPALAVNASGQALAAWAGASFSATPLVVAVRPPGGTFATESLAAAGSPRAMGFALAGAALDADGSGVVAYLDDTNVLRVVSRSNAGTWSGPTQISAGAVSGVSALATNADGDAVLVWNEGQTVKSAVRSHDGAFGSAQTVASDGGPNTLQATSVAIAADGTPFVALQRQTQARRICVDSVFQNYTAELWRRSGGTWSSVARQEGQAGRVATSPTGDRVAWAWEGFVDPCAIQNVHAIRVQLGTVAGALGADTLLPDQPGSPTFANTNTSQSIAIDGGGNALVTWSATRPETGGGGKLRVAAFDTGSAPPGGGGGGGTPPGGGSGGNGNPGGNGNDPGRPTVDPTFTDLLGIRAPVRNLPVIGGLPPTIFIDARCIDRRVRCEVDANGVVTGSYRPASASAAAAARRRGRARAVSFSVRLPRVHATIRAGSSARLKITVRGRALTKVRAALKAHGSARLSIALKVNGIRRPKPLAIPFATGRARRR